MRGGGAYSVSKILDYLDGKKLNILGVVIALWGLAKATWPDSVPVVDSDAAAMLLGAVIVILRSVTKKPGALAPGARG